MNKLSINICLLWLMVVVCSCHSKQATEESTTETEVQTPVKVTGISTETMNEYAELNATSYFLQSSIVKSSVNGYIRSVNTVIGKFTPAGKVLFVLQTKEAKSIGNLVNDLDPSLKFSGVINIPASQAGYVTQLDHQVGDYVQDGEQLAVISNSNSFSFLMNVPYELRNWVSLNKAVEVILPDSTHLQGVVASMMPTIDSVSQTQGVVIKVSSNIQIPQNLIAKVRILKFSKPNVVTLPRQAVLTDEAQSEFWIMKMTDSVTAVKVSITKGLETKDRIEIVEPKLTTEDRILIEGNYGLPDTAKVKIMKAE